MADELTIRGKVPATQSSGDLATRGGAAQAHALLAGIQDPNDPGELELCTVLFQQRTAGKSAAIPDDRQPTKEANFCQIMAHGDGTAMLVGLGFSTDLIADSVWHDEARRLGKIINSHSVFIPRPVAERAVMDPKLKLYILAATSLTTAHASYVPARTPEMALKLWNLGKHGLPADVPRHRVLILPVPQSRLIFLLRLPTIVNWERTRELSTGRGSMALR